MRVDKIRIASAHKIQSLKISYFRTDFNTIFAYF